MILSLPSLAKLNSNFEHLSPLTFYTLKEEWSHNGGKIIFYLDINSKDKIQNASVKTDLFKDYAELFCRSLLNKTVSELRLYNEKKFFSHVASEDKDLLQNYFALMNPFFLILEKTLDKHEGIDIASNLLSLNQDDLLCRCENIKKKDFFLTLTQKKGSFQNAMRELNLASSCGNCLTSSEDIYEEYLSTSCFIAGESYVEWVLKLDEYLQRKLRESTEYQNYSMVILSFENLLLKIRVDRKESKESRMSLQSQFQTWVNDLEVENIKVSVIF